MTVHEPGSQPCRCGGTGTVTAVISLSDAVLLDDRPCPDGCQPTSTEATVPPTAGTPKLGYYCNNCLDWGTVVAMHASAAGVYVERHVPCPNHTAAPAVRELWETAP